MVNSIMQNIYGKVYVYIQNLANDIGLKFLSKEDDKYEIYSIDGNKCEFIIIFSKDYKDPRIELQLVCPNSDKYLIIGEFYNFQNNEEEKEQIFKIVKAILSNKIKITQFFYKNRLVKTSYEYGYFIDDDVKYITETFNHKFTFPWERKYTTKYFYYNPWIISDFTQ